MKSSLSIALLAKEVLFGTETVELLIYIGKEGISDSFLKIAEKLAFSAGGARTARFINKSPIFLIKTISLSFSKSFGFLIFG